MNTFFEDLQAGKRSICVVGLGYVGLPLAVVFAKHFKTVGFDINESRIENLEKGVDLTGEVAQEDLAKSTLSFSSDPEVIGQCSLIVVAVPTPVDPAKNPDLGPLIRASRTIGKVMQPGSIVVFESTVYPGVTEQECGRLLAESSGLVCGKEFFLGYSPERVNPGDKEHTIEKIVKVVSGQTPEVTGILERVYGSVVTAGVHVAPNIKTAEAAKVIENTQRDLNIALINELAIIFNKLEIDTTEVLEAAGTKWNFLKFQPGLVGGHCIGIDPYYLTSLAQRLGLHPQVIMAGRRINDGMGRFVVEQTIKRLIKVGCPIGQARVLVLGLTFKEDVPDTRNAKSFEIISELESYDLDVRVHDATLKADEVPKSCRDKWFDPFSGENMADFDGVMLLVKHRQYLEAGFGRLRALIKEKGVFIDVKSAFDYELARENEVAYWRL